MKHEKGPWKNEGTKPTFTGKSQHLITSRGGHRTHNRICEMYFEQNVPKYERDANANLIAAAPDMLEALEELIVLMQDIISGDYKPDSFTMQPAEIAVAKAKGEQS